jgi:ribonuclease PH
MRKDGRTPEDPRPITITRDFQEFAEGSCLIELGQTRVLCAASFEERVPPFLRGTGRGWVTAEYSMLPRSTSVRTPREVQQGRPSGRTQEIQRLIGRSLRAVTELGAFGEATVTVDCDVLVADGGTRTAAITGSYVALHDAFRRMRDAGAIERIPLTDEGSSGSSRHSGPRSVPRDASRRRARVAQSRQASRDPLDSDRGWGRASGCVVRRILRLGGSARGRPRLRG